MTRRLMIPMQLEARLRRIERVQAAILRELGMDADELDVESSPGVRFGMPATYDEWQAHCRRLAEEADQ